MKPGSAMRVVRPTDNLAKIVKMYVEGLGFTVIAQFTDHEGFDGAILGHPQQPYQFAFTSQRGHHARAAPTKHHLLVFYLPDEKEWAESCQQMVSAGFRVVPPPIHTGIVVAGRSRTLTATAWCCKRARGRADC